MEMYKAHMSDPLPKHRLITEPGLNSSEPLALCGDLFICWTTETTADCDNSSDRLIIRVSILNSTPNTKARQRFVKSTVRTWERYANIQLKFVPPSKPSDIRLLYAEESWSYVGIDGREHRQTMRLKYIQGDDKRNRQNST
ncbi:hypothetical protein F4804DRAFT_200246 [Jackrogersella minutella]|nr:hypothetical protein F4804DRAFT_200246 [Jackrogersella minutella]